jgi:hypothetical protein
MPQGNGEDTGPPNSLLSHTNVNIAQRGNHKFEMFVHISQENLRIMGSLGYFLERDFVSYVNHLIVKSISYNEMGQMIIFINI